LKLSEAYAAYDANRIFDLQLISAEEPAECISALVLQGLKKPTDCPAFAMRCTPENPLGAPMVSAEGACAAYYHYRRHAGHDVAGHTAQTVSEFQGVKVS
jgi:hydrogenase expression/formation protein HypD